MKNINLIGRIIQEIDEYQLSENQKKGFLFHLGYTVDQYARYIGVYGQNGLMKNKPISFILSDDLEIDEDSTSYSTDSIRGCYYTIAKVIHELWVENETSIDEFINVGPQFLFTGEIISSLWEDNIDKSFNGLTIDTGILDFLECLGKELEEIEVQSFEEYIWHGNYLAMWSMMDDYKSYSFIVDKINAVLSPYLKTILHYPISVEIDIENFHINESFVQVLLSTLKLEDHRTFRQLGSKWSKKVFLESSGIIENKYHSFTKNIGNILMQLAADAFAFRNELNSIQFQEIENAGNVYDLGALIGQDIDLEKYATIIAQITHQQFGYDFRENYWLNKGTYLQFLSFYFILSMRYSVYFNSLIQNE
jgi:hypothetical protein